MIRLILETDDKKDLILIKKLAERLQIKYSEENTPTKSSNTRVKNSLKKNIDISNFGDPSDWQRKVRKDRKLI
ncbi:MAG: hypothetical protein ACK4R9_12900 [Ignavibacterium sp.]